MARILIVDDDAFFVSRLQSILSDEFDIDVALSFEEAKDKFRPDYYDAVMIDVRLREV
ncbi:TPA: response regulator, partial [Candidatus Poribacteria bacterium]|nr:response regulator [Candidatus Poribacteria bacterium]HEX30729.1 response regulator [Candidatus Poribacteria bacterium]